MTKKRPGVEAGVNLVSLEDVETWEKVERYCQEVIGSIQGLSEYEAQLERLGRAKESFTKAELDQVVLWKHTVGKNRIYNVKYLNANSDEVVQQHSRSAITLALTIRLEDFVDNKGELSQTGRKAIQEAMGELSKLKGVGPATASAVLTLVRPDVFCYLYDEVIDVFEPQRDYKISNYLRVNSRCLQIAQKLGSGWTASRVAKTIWTAARFLATSGQDPTSNASPAPAASAPSKNGSSASKASKPAPGKLKDDGNGKEGNGGPTESDDGDDNDEEEEYGVDDEEEDCEEGDFSDEDDGGAAARSGRNAKRQRTSS